MSTCSRPRPLRPAPSRNIILPSMIAPPNTCFYDLPAELRIEIYRLALDRVTVYILPSTRPLHHPHPLLRTSRQIRNEVLPIIHAHCKIKAKITDFDFTGLLEWMRRIPSDQEANLCKNDRLIIELKTTINETKNQSCHSIRNSASLRKWLHMRADQYRPQPTWNYIGTRPGPDAKTAYELKRRAIRMKEVGEVKELWIMLGAMGVSSQSDHTWIRHGSSWDDP